MPVPDAIKKCLRLPSRVAVLLGLGALSVAGARADAPELQPGGMAVSHGGALVRAEDGKIYLSEGGRETELRLGATPQRDRLLLLLQPHGAAGVKLDADPRLIMSGGGGSGFSLHDITKSVTGEPAAGSQPPPRASTPRSPPEQGSAPRDHSRAASKKG
jgi:hypothetical protein